MVAMGDDPSLGAARAAALRASVTTKKIREGFRKTRSPFRLRAEREPSHRFYNASRRSQPLVDAQQPTATSINKCDPGVLVTSPRFAHNCVKIFPST